MARPSHPPAGEDEDPQTPPKSLLFNEPLSWKAGKAIPVTTLIKRLTVLSKELSELEQEDVDRESLETPAKELAAIALMQHRDDGVKAFTACCLADMLRLHAPDAPYTAHQLKEIFTCFVNCLKGLEDPEAPYLQQHIYLLDSLSTVKSVVLISDIPDSEEITLALFTSFFDIAKPEGSKNVEYHMTDILIQLIDECNSLPTDVVDIIMAQFLRMTPGPTLGGKKGRTAKIDDKQTKLTTAVPPPAYNMAKTICNACVDKMARQICQYFSDVIMDVAPSRGRKNHSGSPDGDVEEDMGGHEPTHEEMHELNKAHQLAKELWKACPAVLQNVIPQLEQELLANNGELRKLACETIGEMALTGNFLSSAPATWKVWVSRANDKSPGVRAKWVEAAVRVLKERSDAMAVQLIDLIAIKLNDLDDSVRFAVCQALRMLDYNTITTKLTADQSPFNTYDSSNSIAGAGAGRKGKPDNETTGWGKRMLQTLAERVRDKKIHVRLEGMRCLARMWDMAYKDIAGGNEVIATQLGWIPSKILDTFYINDAEVNVLLDHVLHEILIPVNYPPIEKERFGDAEKQTNGGSKGKGKEKETAGDSKDREREVLEGDKIRVQRLLVLIRGLDTKAKRALFAVPLRQISYAKVMEVFLKACEDNNGGIIEDDVDEKTVETTLDKFSGWLSHKLPEPPKAKENLLKFAKLHDRRCYQLIRFCFNPESDYRTVVKALKEIKKRIGESSQAVILDSLTPLLYRVSQLIYNKSHVAPIVEFSRTDELGLGPTAHEVLKEMSSSNPAVFKANVKALSDLLQEQSPSSGAPDSSGAVDTLKACAGFAKSYPKDMPQERKLLQALVSFALTGSPPAAAKHAVTILMHSANRKELYASDLLKRCIKDFAFGQEHFLAKLACLGQLVLLAPDQCEDETQTIKDIVADVLGNVRTPKLKGEGPGEEQPWAEDSELDDEIKAKLLALRVLVNRVRSHTEAQIGENAGVIKTLIQIVVNDGMTSKAKETPEVHRARMRLAAAQHLLKLATHKQYDDLIPASDFHRLAVIAQDPCFQVRQAFVNKLTKYLASSKLSHRFYTVVFLMAYEPRESWKEEVVIWIKARAAQLSKSAVTAGHNVMEGIFARLMSLLVHHPDFGTQVKDLTDFARYIMFYLTAVANEDNISLIYYIAQRAKQYRDRLSPTNPDNLYYVSELSQAVMRHYAELHHWSIQTWPGKLRLPAALYAPMQSAKESQDVSKKTFLPKDLDQSIGTMVRTSKARAGAAPTAKKRKTEDLSSAASATPTTKLKRVKSESVTKSKKPAPKKKKKVANPPSGERRRSGRHATRVANYNEDAESEDGENDDEEHGDGEHDDEEHDDGDTDDEMADLDETSEGQSESEPEERPKRSRGGGRRKSAASAKGKEKALPSSSVPPEESMDLDLQDNDDAEERAKTVTPAKGRAKEKPTAASPETSTVTVGSGKGPTRATRASRRTRKDAQPSSELSEAQGDE